MKDRILEIGEAGLAATDEKVKALMQNMANSQTPGYKKVDVVTRAFPLELQSATDKLSSKSMQPVVEGSFYDHLQGALVKTNNKLDVALADANVYFSIYGSWGEGYSRDGRFIVDKDGKLVTRVGNFQVLGQNGPIVLNSGEDIDISQTGEIKVKGETVDRIRVVKIDQTEELEPVNGVVFKSSSPSLFAQEVEVPRVLSGFIEASNVSIIDSMMDLIFLSRVQGIDTKIIQTRDSSLSRAMEMGRVQ